ncbi:putative Major intrinsic protein [Trypanosoma vivax]|uniref:Putative aquaporin 3 n=1 Tax=Trypanosoma vivax (strain Y486) TaxID=1055687 RepID=G0U4F4_TRYVY|nr:putative aquaporin 3 [Trypanosoma vivax]KAH8611131.1 putative Major intrinsic protein [Trypanosoma vivax]CCC52318.1 putative aquaporin 3 [Trypanosoma vivax Y486]
MSGTAAVEVGPGRSEETEQGREPMECEQNNGEGERPSKLDVNRWPPYGLRMAYREYIAEFFGTLVLLLMGNGVVATCSLDKSLNFLSITLGWGMAVTMGLYVSLGISGGHLNPAVTVANAVWGKFPWRKVPGYICAQVFGAFTGAACAYSIFADLLKEMNGGNFERFELHVAGIFSTYPRPGNGLFSCFLGEMLCTAILLFCVCGIFDNKNWAAKGHEPLAVGALVFAIGINIGYATGYAINPARDFGPRLFSSLLLGKEVFTYGNCYFWVPIVAPLLGGIFGHFLYSYVVPH